jgi:tetratricopeptide (TPR) repeat protein
MTFSLAQSQFEAALKAVETDAASPAEKAEMLMEIAMGLQQQPKTAEPLRQAIELYRRALGICPADSPLLSARITMRLGTALQALPGAGDEALREARDCYESALARLQGQARPPEIAEIELNLGLVLQSLAPGGAARVHDAIQCYHRALRTFTREEYPQEFAILHNNLAIAYLSIPLSDERGRMREALAVQSFEEVLKVITLVDHPSEYAMIQNNLGNALQYVSSGHALQNTLRALEAYDEALKVRTARDTPLEYANTLANKANALRNLPDDPQRPGLGREAALSRARELYREALGIFLRMSAAHGAETVEEALMDIERELGQLALPQGNGGASAHALS